MSAILTKQDQIPGAEMADLLATYAHYAGRAVARFSSRVVAERRVLDALMSSADARGHLGIPKDTQPAPTAHAELVKLADDTGRADPAEMARDGLPGSTAGVEPAEGTNPYPPGSLAARLWAQAAGAPVPPEPRPAPKAVDPAPRGRPSAGSLPGWWAVSPVEPTARLQKTSERSQVYDMIVAAAGPCSMVALVERFGAAARGHVGKLRATHHIVEVSPPKGNA